MEDNNLEILSEDEQVSKKRGKLKRMKNLAQYKDLSDDDFDREMTLKAMGTNISEEFEKRIRSKLSEFEEDYDLSDLKINDKDSLRALIQAHLALEDYEQYLFKLRASGIGLDSANEQQTYQKIMSDLRSDIAKIQIELNISRKVRKSDQDVSVLAYIENLKDKAKKFYENKMGYIFCPKCNMLLGTIWVLYGEEEKNKVQLVCNRITADGTKCGEKVVISTKELIKNRGTNKKEITPESLL